MPGDMQNNELRLETYRNEEVRAAIQELFSYPAFLDGMKAFLPPQLGEYILQAKEDVETAYDFQKEVIYPFLKLITKTSMTGLSASGLEQLNPDEKYLFISNHRDIGLDSAFLNVLLFENGFPTSQIAIGDNLMKHRIAELIFRINKSFVVKRIGTPRELYDYSVRLSNYIQDLITQKKDSVWIAQREGRAKDGNDRTQVGLLKMLSLSNTKDLRTYFQRLRVVPVAISYEFDPCGQLKMLEFLKKNSDPTYKKDFQEDVKQILLGLRGDKGQVHIHFGKPLHEELEVLDTAVGNKNKLEALAAIIDRAIHLNYRLHPVNYVAHDLLMETLTYQHKYTSKEWEHYQGFFANQTQSLPAQELEAGRRYLLAMYANPLLNANSYAPKE